MNESDIELLRVRLGSALIFLLKVSAKYRPDEDLTRACTAVEQARTILGRTHFETGGLEDAASHARASADVVHFDRTEESHYPSAPVARSPGYIRGLVLAGKYYVGLVTIMLSRWYAT